MSKECASNDMLYSYITLETSATIIGAEWRVKGGVGTVEAFVFLYEAPVPWACLTSTLIHSTVSDRAHRRASPDAAAQSPQDATN